MSLVFDVTADQPSLPSRLTVQELTPEEVASLTEELVAYLYWLLRTSVREKSL